MAKFFVGFIIFAYSPIRNPDMQEVMLTIGWADLKSFLSVGYILFVIVTIAVIIHDKREPVKALSWIIVISLLPVVGFVFYIVFGRNHRKQKLFNRKELHDLEQIDALSRQQIYESIIRRCCTSPRSAITAIPLRCCSTATRRC